MLLIGECLTMAAPARAEGLVIDGGRIAALGRADDLRARWPGMRRVRVERISPGVHDAHVHPTLWGQALAALDLSGLTDPRAVAARIGVVARTAPPGAWLRGGGFLFGAAPDGALLDAAAPDNPVFVTSRDLHSAWANRPALAAAGVDAGTPEPDGGRIVRDADGGPTGYLLERAAALVARAAPPPTAADFERGLADLAGRGYTAAHVMPYGAGADLAWAERLAGAGSLPLRLWWAVGADEIATVAPGWRGGELEVAAVKLFADGALGSRTAWMHEPYASGGAGMPVEAPARLRELARSALGAGFGLAVHAIGTRAVADVLALLAELAPQTPRRSRIEHAQHLRDAELPRLRPARAAVSMQPIHLQADAALVGRDLPGREREAFRFRTLLRAGMVLAFGSDAPVAPPDLEAGIAAASHHPLTSGESISWVAAVRAFTRGAALAAGWDGDGTLRPDGRADLALWEGGRLVGRVFGGRLEWLASR